MTSVLPEFPATVWNGSADPRQEVRDLIRSREPGHALPGAFYTSQDLFDLDMELVFGRHWIFVGSEPEVPEPGDYLTVNLGKASVFVLRDDDEEVRAFHNVCRHRGSRLLNQPRGSVGNVVCPYHSWTYNTCGQLLFAESVPNLDRSQFGLKPVPLRSVAGLLFICLAEQPPDDIDTVAEQVEPYLLPHDLRGCTVAQQIDLVEDGNWKLVMENNRECYHCGGHPELGMSLFPTIGYPEEAVDHSRRATYDRFQRAGEEMTDVWQRRDLPWQQVSRLDEDATGFLVERTPLDGAGESITPDTHAASAKRLGQLDTHRLGRLGLHTQPNSWHHAMADHVVTFAVLPLGPNRTLLRTTWLVHQDAVEGVDYDPSNLTTVWKRTNAQDAEFVAGAQAGVADPAYQPGPYSPAEGWVDQFCSWYLKRLDAGLATCSPQSQSRHPAEHL